MSIQSEIDRIKNAVGNAYLAVSEKNGALPEDLSVSSLHDSIKTIPIATSSNDPVEVYNATRPKDWYPMPTPNENEIYLLMNVPKDGSALLAFRVTCTDNYTVTTYECTTLSNLTEITTETLASNAKFQAIFLGSDLENGYLTSDGMHQVLVKISGERITAWVKTTHSKKTSPSDHTSWNILEIKAKLPNVQTFSCNGLGNIRYFSLIGENDITNMSSMFSSCYSLTSIPALDTSKVTNMSGVFSSCCSLTSIPALDTSKVTNMTAVFDYCYSLTSIPALDTSKVTNMSGVFNYCYSLTSIPALDTSNVTNMTAVFNYCYSLTSIPALDTSNAINMSSMFSSCCSLTSIPALDTSKVTNMSNAFRNCYSLTSIPALDTSKVTNMTGVFDYCCSLTSIPALDTSKVTSMSNAFRNCYSLTSIPALDTSKVTSMSSMFSNCDALSHVIISPSTTGWGGVAISLQDCSLLHGAIVDFFNSLPTITTSKVITLTGNPGVSDLTDEDKAIATNKGWTLTL